MANIDKVSVKNTVYNIVSPAVVSDYIEVIGGACTKPDGYVEDEVILAKQNDVQLLFKATQTIAFGANIVENTNCVRTTLEEVLKNAGGGGGASSADQVSYDNSDSGLEAENVQEAVDELATNAGTASSQIQTLTNEAYLTGDTTENSLAENDVIPFYDTSASAKRKTTFSNLFGQMVSNRNLLDNPFFTINQRGASSYDASTSAKYTLDRWWSIFANVEVTEDGVVLSSPSGLAYAAFLRQAIIGEKALRGKKCTFSIDVAEITGTCNISIIKATGMNAGQVSIGVLDFTTTGIHTLTVTIPDDAESNTYPYLMVAISAKNIGISSLKIRSAKFEEGEHSTLALDAEPNYATELLKCQRYFVRLHNESIGNGMVDGANSCACVVPVPVPMRATPSLTLNGVIGVGLDDGTFGSLTSITSWDDSGITCVGFSGSGITHAAGSSLRLFLTNDNSLDISADL